MHITFTWCICHFLASKGIGNGILIDYWIRHIFVKILKIHNFSFLESRRCLSTKLLWLIQLFNDIWTCQLDIHVLIIIWTSRSESVYKILHAVLLRLYAVNHNSQLVTSTTFCFFAIWYKISKVSECLRFWNTHESARKDYCLAILIINWMEMILFMIGQRSKRPLERSGKANYTKSMTCVRIFTYPL